MLKIRPRQLAAITRDQQTRLLADDLTAMVRELEDERYQSLSGDQLRQRVEAGIRRAWSFGLSADEGIRVYVTLLFRVGPFFDERPAIREVLERDTSADEKLDLLARLPEREWAVATVTADPARWSELIRSAPP